MEDQVGEWIRGMPSEQRYGQRLQAWRQPFLQGMGIASHSFMVWVSEQCLPPVGAKSQGERSSAEKRPSAHSVSACGALPHGPYFVHDRDISELRRIATRLYVKTREGRNSTIG